MIVSIAATVPDLVQLGKDFQVRLFVTLEDDSIANVAIAQTAPFAAKEMKEETVGAAGEVTMTLRLLSSADVERPTLQSLTILVTTQKEHSRRKHVVLAVAA